AHEQTAVLQRVGEVLRDQDGRIAIRRLGQADRRDCRQAQLLQVSKRREFALRRLERLLLQGEEAAAGRQEPNEVSRRPDLHLPEAVLVPPRQRQLPGQAEQLACALAQTQARESRGCRRFGSGAVAVGVQDLELGEAFDLFESGGRHWKKGAGCCAIAQLPWSRPEAMTKGLRRTPLYRCPGNCRMATDDDRRRRGLPISNVVLATARMAPHKGYRRGSAVVPIHGPVLQDRVPPRMARPEGFEPPTLWSEATCSGPLS